MSDDPLVYITWEEDSDGRFVRLKVVYKEVILSERMVYYEFYN